MTQQEYLGQTVIVTGAGSGIGQQIASKFLERGATVVAADLNTEGAPKGSHQVTTDVSDASAVQALIETTIRLTGRIDILCNNAGLSSVTGPIECTPEEWDRVFAVNTKSVFLGTKYALPFMLAQGAGVIVNTASAAGLIGLPDRAAYCASKGAVISFTRQVAVQYASQGIRCNCICPGTVDSPWVERLLEGSDNPQALRTELIARQPMGRLGVPSEIADAVLYLSSPAASFITGTALVIDGGIVAG
jgi:NAD(P)-dependent dehydrogenase (short-subunit alcohol dehydrogenase family)